MASRGEVILECDIAGRSVGTLSLYCEAPSSVGSCYLKLDSSKNEPYGCVFGKCMEMMDILHVMNILGRIVLVIRCCGRRQSLKLPRPIRGISAQFFMQTSKEICGKFSCYSHPLCRWALKQEVLPSPPKEFTVHAFVYVRMCLHDCAMCVGLPLRICSQGSAREDMHVPLWIGLSG